MMAKALQSCSGTVLMEWVVMLPIYFSLLSGCFLLGEMIVNKIRLQVGDHTVTWLVGDRMGQQNITPEEAMTYLFSEKFDGNGRFRVDRGTDVEAMNHFATIYRGGVKFDLALPDWILGPLDLGNVMSEESSRDVDAEGRAFLWSRDAANVPLFALEDENGRHLRSYSLHRVKPMDFLPDDDAMYAQTKNDYNRARTAPVDIQEWAGVDAGSMLANGIFVNVLGDNWIEDAGQPISTANVSGDPPSAMQRFLHEFGQ